MKQGAVKAAAISSATQTCRPCPAQEFPGPLRVLRDSGWLSLADLHCGRSEVNEPLNDPRLGSRPAKGVPELLPGLVRFPGEALVEEVEGMEPPRVSGKERRQSATPEGWVVRKVVEREWG